MTENTLSPDEALATLLDGNHRFVGGEREHPHQDADRRAALAPAQHPFAVLFGCSDSRLAAEIIFDQGLGDLFVVRTAGHVLGPEVLGTIEYGVEVLGAPLIAVLGHDSCGAVAAAQQSVRDGSRPSGFVRDVVERVMLSVLAAPDGAHDAESAIGQHVRHTVELLLDRSATIAKRVADGSCGIAGMYYRLEEGSARVIASEGLKTGS
ncbi:carbonic anhydrase [Amycolatopsis sp. 195334CR]|uniref:carbonic anhydrase n=1 Tax=Amycolatopsis sp. 195334CR TaxID=2814588 RepID=UPI001A8D88F7|nr:carbonic anhydrase [Amycolatopsis sp. 195334CR]MBN6039910.1 carbonic anhydrase [Amycolatopsis sp. 195334CR]